MWQSQLKQGAIKGLDRLTRLRELLVCALDVPLCVSFNIS